MRTLTQEQMAMVSCYGDISKEEMLRQIELGREEFMEEELKEDADVIHRAIAASSDQEFTQLKEKAKELLLPEEDDRDEA